MADSISGTTSKDKESSKQSLDDKQFRNEGDTERLLKNKIGHRSPRSKQDIMQIDYLTEVVENEKNDKKDWNSSDSSEIDALLKEYESLRTESLNTITIRAQSIIFGLTVIGAIYAGAMQIDNPEKNWKLITLLFSGVIPMITLILLILWVGEAMRMRRASDFIAGDIEAKINKKFGKLVLTYEQCLKTEILPRDKFFGPSAIIMFLLIMNSIVSPIIGVLLSGRDFIVFSASPIWIPLIPWFFILLIILFFLVQRKRIIADKVAFTAINFDK